MTPNDWPTMSCGCPALSGWCEHMTTEYRKRPIGEGPFARIRELQDRNDELERWQQVVNAGNWSETTTIYKLNRQIAELKLDVSFYKDAFNELQVVVNEQAEEIKILRQWGNKDCTAMADEELERLRKESNTSECDGVKICGHCPVCSE